LVVAALLVLACGLAVTGTVQLFSGIASLFPPTEQHAETAQAQPTKTTEKARAPVAVTAQEPPLEGELAEVVEALHSPDFTRRKEAAKRLWEMTPDNHRKQVAKALLPLLNDSDPFTRQEGIKAMGVWATEESIELLIQLLDDSDPFTRRSAIVGLGASKAERAAIPLAKQMAKWTDWPVAGHALQALGPKAESAVIPYLKNSDVRVRREACTILGVIGTKASEAALREAVQERALARDADDALRKIATRGEGR
jgi:HEAT repeat protein